MKRKNILMALIMIVATFFAGTYVANAIINAPNQLVISYYTKNKKDNPLGIDKKLHVKRTSDGKYVYCIDYMKLRSDGKTYNKVSETNDLGLAYIVNQGYDDSNETDYFITQSAVWLYLDDKGAMQKDTTGTVDAIRSAVYSSANNNNSVAVKIRNLVSNAKKASKEAEPYLNVVTKNIEFELTEDGRYYISNLVKIDTNLDDYDVNIVNAPDETFYTDSADGIYVFVPAANLDDLGANFRVEISAKKTVYKTFIYNPTVSGYQPVAVPYSEKLTFKGEARATIDTTIVSISKKDATTKKELPGATLVLKNDKGEIVETWVSTDEEHVIYNLPLGKYTLIEEKAPDGYVLSKEEITFELTEVGVEKRVVMYNDVEEEIEVPVEPTSSFSTMTTGIVGLIVIGLGSMLIYKNYKKNEE